MVLVPILVVHSFGAIKMKPLLLLIALIAHISCFEWPSVNSALKESCLPRQAFDTTNYVCFNCPANSSSIRDGLGCQCDPGFRTLSDTGFYGGYGIRNVDPGLICQACPNDHVVTQDGRDCIKCSRQIVKRQCECSPDEIILERDVDGVLLKQIECMPCRNFSRPSSDQSQCVPCHRVPLLVKMPPTCNCSFAGGICLPENLGIAERYSPSSKDEIVRFSDQDFHSSFFKEHVKVAAYLCYKLKNISACHLLGNLCTMALHDLNHPACDLIYSLSMRDRLPQVPNLFFSERMTTSVTTEEDIQNVYSFRGQNSRLNITAAQYDLRGRLISLETVPGMLLQMCNGSYQEFEAAYAFGTNYLKKCKIPTHRLFANSEPIFFDLFVPYVTKMAGLEETKMYALPMRIRNMERNKEDNDQGKWQFTTRFFMVDTVSGVPVSNKDSSEQQPKHVRYLSKLELRVRMLNTREDPQKAGRIYPPLIVIEYGEIAKEDLAKDNSEVDFTFEVNYEMSMKESKKDIEIAAGVMSVFAVLWSGVQTWSWSRRSGKVTIDPMTFIKLVLFTCSNLANIFLAIVFFSSLVWASFYKFQDHIHIMLPSPEQEMLIKHYVIAIFALKVVDVAHLIVSQITVDIFLLDWERPKAVSSSINPHDPSKEEAVSVWRTYLVANEWNELQTRRKTHLALQIVFILLLFKVVGLEHLTTADPKSSLSLQDGEYHSPYSFTCRFALGVVVYVGVALLQLLFWTIIYTGLVENKLEQFSDVCSLSNISVFVLTNSNFGYYIHGKSAHGSADTDMATLIEQLQREADDRCPHRGLQAQTDDQSFIMTLPTKLRSYYDKIVTPATDMAGIKGGPRISKLSGNAIQHMVEAYSTMNRFLTRFLEHALKDLDYEIKDRLFLERVLDVEFQDVNITEKAIFYADNGHAFDSVLFYGNEFTLLTFDMMVFIFVDLFAHDYLLAGIVTYFVGEFANFLRYHLGKQNLARKTLIDKRFLI